MTGDMFGVTKPTCGDSLDLACNRGVPVGKMSIQGKASAEHPRIRKKCDMSTYRSRMSRKGRFAAAAQSGHDRAGRWRHRAGLAFAPVRPGFVAACMVKTPDGAVASGAGKPSPVGHPESDKGNIFPMTGKRLSSGARRAPCLAGRESDRARDLPVATLSSNACVKSNIFGFVMT
jgi:hypothetical protein